MKSIFDNSLQLLQKTREKILRERESTQETQTTQGQLRSQPSFPTDFSESEEEDNSIRLKHKFISAGVLYKRNGVGVKTSVDLNQLRHEIKLRESDQFEREKQMKTIMQSDSSQEEQQNSIEMREKIKAEAEREAVEVLSIDENNMNCCCGSSCRVM